MLENKICVIYCVSHQDGQIEQSYLKSSYEKYFYVTCQKDLDTIKRAYGEEFDILRTVLYENEGSVLDKLQLKNISVNINGQVVKLLSLNLMMSFDPTVMELGPYGYGVKAFIIAENGDPFIMIVENLKIDNEDISIIGGLLMESPND